MDIKKYKGIIFDLDGTFIDSMNVWHEVDYQFFKRRNMEIPEGYKKAINKMPFTAAAEYTKKEYNISETVEEIIDEWHSLVIEEYKHNVKLKDGGKEFIKFCKSAGLKCAYATASADILCETVLKANKVRQYFDSKTYVYEVEKDKSFPDVYLLAAQKIGVNPSECIVVEDILAGIKSAKSGGFTTVAMFDESSKDDWNEMCAIADVNIRSFTELM